MQKQPKTRPKQGKNTTKQGKISWFWRHFSLKKVRWVLSVQPHLQFEIQSEAQNLSIDPEMLKISGMQFRISELWFAEVAYAILKEKFMESFPHGFDGCRVLKSSFLSCFWSLTERNKNFWILTILTNIFNFSDENLGRQTSLSFADREIKCTRPNWSLREYFIFIYCSNQQGSCPKQDWIPAFGRDQTQRNLEFLSLIVSKLR